MNDVQHNIFYHFGNNIKNQINKKHPIKIRVVQDMLIMLFTHLFLISAKRTESLNATTFNTSMPTGE